MKQLLFIAATAILFTSCATLPKGVSFTGDSDCAQVTVKVPSKPPVTIYYCDTDNIDKIDRMIREAIERYTSK